MGAKERGRIAANDTAMGACSEIVLCSESQSTTDEAKLQRARQRTHDAKSWIRTFPQPWAYVCDYLAMEFAAGHRISMQTAWEDLRAKEWSGTKGERFGLNNDLRPVLARILLREHPEYKGKLEIRRSQSLDAVMGFGGEDGRFEY